MISVAKLEALGHSVARVYTSDQFFCRRCGQQWDRTDESLSACPAGK